jgi:hypothetical protein
VYKLVAKDAILLMKVMKLSEQLANVSPELTSFEGNQIWVQVGT